MNRGSSIFIDDLCRKIDDNNSPFFLCLSSEKSDDPKNLIRKLKSKKHRRAIAAFLEWCEFDYDFNVVLCPVMKVFRETFDGYIKVPVQIDLKGWQFVGNMPGVQYATFNLETLELTFTQFNVHPCEMFNSCQGKGRIPINQYGEFDMEKFIPLK